jgi:uncharacterized membrane protein
MLAMLLLVAAAGCTNGGAGTPGARAGGAAAASAAGSTAAASSTPAGRAGPYATIGLSAGTPHENAALAAVPAALQAAASQKSSQGQPMPASVSDATAVLFAYVLTARVGGRETLFEVRADGKAYQLYRYPAPPDPASLLYTDAATGAGAAVAKPGPR